MPDYKFFCFNGTVYAFYIRVDYANHHEEGKMAFYLKNLERMWGKGFDYCAVSDRPVKLPSNILEMIAVAEKLSQGFPHLRVDLYSVKNQIKFGEMTFFNASGYMNCIPDGFDFMLGEPFVLPERNR